MLNRRRLAPRETSAVDVPDLSARAAVHPQVTDLMRRARRTRRAAELVEAVSRIDTATDPATLQALAAWIDDAYAQREGGELLGLFARCYLGPPYIDHRLSLAGTITEHYTPGDQVPPGFLPCRALARSDAYLFIEVYSDGQVIPIRATGDAVC